MTGLLIVQPPDLKFTFELLKQSSCSVTLTNTTVQCVAFKVKTTTPKKYCVRPHIGIIKPNSTINLRVTMQAQRTTPADMQCNDKFLIQSTIVPHEKMEDTIISEMFMKYKAKYIHENKLKVLLISPPESPVWQPVNGVLKEYFPDNSSTLNEKLQIGVENLPPPHEVTEMMGLVIIQPLDLKFTFELRKQSSCSVTLTNTTAQCVAFKVKTTTPKKYCIRPNIGIIKPNSTINLIVTMQAQRTTPADMQCKDNFLIQSTIVPHEKMEGNILSEMFVKDKGKYIQENKLRIFLISPPESLVWQPGNGVLKEDSPDKSSTLKQKLQIGVENLPPPHEAEQTASKLNQEKETIAKDKETLMQEKVLLRKAFGLITPLIRILRPSTKPLRASLMLLF